MKTFISLPRLLLVLAILVAPLQFSSGLSVSGINGTRFLLSWNEDSGFETFHLSVIRPTSVAYCFNTGDKPQLSNYDFLCDNVLISTDSHYGIHAVRIGDSMSIGSLTLPAARATGIYRLTVMATASKSDNLGATLYLHRNSVDGNRMTEEGCYFSSCDYFETETHIIEGLTLAAGESLVLVAGIENSEDSPNDGHGQVAIQALYLEEITIDETLAATTLSREIASLLPATTYNCELTAFTSEGSHTEQLTVTTLPCRSVFPEPDKMIAYEDIELTSQMEARFDQEIVTLHPDLIAITPRNWASVTGGTTTGIIATLSADNRSVIYHPDSPDGTLLTGETYTITFSEGALSFVDGTSSAAFSYQFPIAMYATGTTTIRGDNPTNLRYTGLQVISATDAMIRLYDTAGRLVATGSGCVPLSNLPQGIYIARCDGELLKVVR